MKAVVLKEVGVLEVQDVPGLAPDQIKVKIAYAGICGSDPKAVDRKEARGHLKVPSVGRKKLPRRAKVPR